MPFGFGEGTAAGGDVGMPDFTRRENVDAGTDVIDLNAMRAELEAERRRRHGGGERR